MHPPAEGAEWPQGEEALLPWQHFSLDFLFVPGSLVVVGSALRLLFALLVTCCVASGKLLDLSEPRVSHLDNGYN